MVASAAKAIRVYVAMATVQCLPTHGNRPWQPSIACLPMATVHCMPAGRGRGRAAAVAPIGVVPHPPKYIYGAAHAVLHGWAATSNVGAFSRSLSCMLGTPFFATTLCFSFLLSLSHRSLCTPSLLRILTYDRYDRERCVREYRTVQPPRAACFLEPEAAALQSRDPLLVVAERGQISVWDIRVTFGLKYVHVINFVIYTTCGAKHEAGCPWLVTVSDERMPGTVCGAHQRGYQQGHHACIYRGWSFDGRRPRPSRSLRSPRADAGSASLRVLCPRTVPTGLDPPHTHTHTRARAHTPPFPYTRSKFAPHSRNPTVCVHNHNSARGRVLRARLCTSLLMATDGAIRGGVL